MDQIHGRKYPGKKTTTKQTNKKNLNRNRSQALLLVVDFSHPDIF